MLTDTKLCTLKPRANAYRLADTNGLCIEIRQTGSKVWRYRFRHVGNASIASLGEYPSISLAEARAERDKARMLVEGGTNPAHVAKIEHAARLEQASNTFASVALRYMGFDSDTMTGHGFGAMARMVLDEELGFPRGPHRAPAGP
jgi:hypothetical protein